MHDDEPGVEVRVVAQHLADDVILEPVVGEERLVRLEEYECAVLLLCVECLVLFQYASLEIGPAHDTVTV